MNQDAEDLEFEPAPPDKLYAHNRRQLSAMLDGELSPDQARFMLRRLQHDTELADCWERWQVCGDVLRGQGHALLPADFSRRVALAIAAPDSGASVGDRLVRAGGRRPRVLRWGGGALAASMALVALFMARQLPDTQLPTATVGGDMVAEATTAPSRAQQAQQGLARGPEAAARAVPGDMVAGAVAPASPVPEGSEGAWAAAGGVAAAELPRRAAERRSRGQSQRAARRVAMATAPARAAAATGPSAAAAVNASLPTPVDAMPLFADLPDARAFGAPANAPFGAQAVAPSRPWPRAVLPGLAAGSQPFSARYGLPSAPSDAAFAPFQPRLVEPFPARQASEPAEARDAQPEPGADNE